MRTFDFEVYRFTDVVEQTSAFGEVYVYPEFGSHKTREMSDFERVLQYVLTVTRSEFKSAEQFDEFGMNTE